MKYGFSLIFTKNLIKKTYQNIKDVAIIHPGLTGRIAQPLADLGINLAKFSIAMAIPCKLSVNFAQIPPFLKTGRYGPPVP